MNKELAGQETNQSATESKLFGLPRSVAGAMLGVLVYILFLFTVWNTKSTILITALLAPGLLIIMLLEGVGMPMMGYLGLILSFLISGVLPAIIGSVIVSTQKATRINGVIFFIIYLFTSAALGIFLLTYNSVV